jgi:hypothetical protein
MRVAAGVAVLLTSGVIVAAPVPAASAQDCPTAQSARNGFVVERDQRSKTEVHVGSDAIVRTTLRHDGKALLERTQFEGLFDLDRLDRGHRSVFRPKTDLASLFPLKVGRTIKAEFDVEDPRRPASAAIEFSIKKADTLYIGPCKYQVLKMERRESRGASPLRFVYTDHYAPDLKLIIAKEYRDKGDRTTLIKFDRIYPIKE